MSYDFYSVAGVTYQNKELYNEVRKQADKKFGKNSYTKNLWVLKEYKRRGGKVKYDGKKPGKESIKKQIRAFEEEFCIDFEQELIRQRVPLELIDARASFDEEIKDLIEDLETLAYCNEETDFMADFIEEAAEKKQNVKLNKPFRTPKGPKKFSVYVKNDKGNIVKVNFGDPKMEIKRDDPNRRSNFRARHNCDNPGPKWKARYWSCKFWSSKPVSSMASNLTDDSFANVFESFEEVTETEELSN
jgi:hypothetical protein